MTDTHRSEIIRVLTALRLEAPKSVMDDVEHRILAEYDSMKETYENQIADITRGIE